MTDGYEFWRDALAGKDVQIHDGHPQAGFYRWRRRGQIDQPVAIWFDGGVMRAMVGGRDDAAEEIWTYVADKPIAEEVYRAVVAGEPWPDLAPSVGLQTNSETADPAEMLRDQIAACKVDLSRFATIVNDTQQAAAQSLRSRLLELGREADKTRETLKAPHLEAGKAVDAKWRPLVKDAKAAADTIAAAMSAWETAKASAAAVARYKAEEFWRKTEDVSRWAAGAGMAPVLADQLIDAPAEPSSSAAPIKGAYGRAASVRTVRIATVIDYNRLYEAIRDNSELKALMQKIAQKIVDGGETVAGVEVTEERRVV